MKSDSDPSSNDKIPSFFSNDIKNNSKSLGFQKITNNTNSNEITTNTYPTKAPRVTNRIHLPSLAIGAGIAVVCIFCGVLIVNVINNESSETLDEISIKDSSDLITEITLSSLTDNASPYLGNPNAPLTMIEFGDYQCTFCNKFFHETEPSILTDYIKTGKVKILFKDFIVVGADSLNAANASHCANDQNAFWEYHSILYNNWAGEGTGWANLENLHKFANTLGLDMNTFSQCMSELKWQELVKSSYSDGIALGVSATPTFFVIDQNNEVIKIKGAQKYDVFKRVFDSQLER